MKLIDKMSDYDATASIQLLERRLLLAAMPFARVSSHGTLLVYGDAQDNDISVRSEIDLVIASIDGTEFSFARSSVKRILVDGVAGDDVLADFTHLPVGVFAIPRVTLRGGDGDDRLVVGGASRDSLEGGGGIDVADYSTQPMGFDFQFPYDIPIESASMTLIVPNNGEAKQLAPSPSKHDVIHWDVEAIIGTPKDDSFGFAAISLFSPTGLGGAGDDSFTWGDAGLGPGIAVAYGGAGNDLFQGVEFHSKCYGGAGDDTLRPEAGTFLVDETFTGGRGRNTIDLGDNDAIDVLDLRRFPDVWNVNGIGVQRTGIQVIGNERDNFLDARLARPLVTLLGLGGNDTLLGGRFDDSLDGGSGNDSINAGGGNDTINGSVGNDMLIGGPGRDRIYGSDGDDVIFARDNNIDRLYGGGGMDSAQVDRSATIIDLLTDVETMLA